MAAHFDASTDSLTLAAAARSGSWTFCALVQLAVDRNDYSSYGPTFDPGTGNPLYLGLGTDSNGTSPCFFDNETGVLGLPGSSGGAFSGMTAGSTWYFVAGSYNSTNGIEIAMFGVGESGSSAEMRTTSHAAGKNGTAPLMIGTNTYGNWWNGAVKEVRIWNTALTQAEMNAEWASPTAIVKSGAWAYYPLTGDALDASGNARHLTVNGTVTFDGGATGSGAITGGADTAAGAGTFVASINKTGSAAITEQRDTAASVATINVPRTGSGAVAERRDTSAGAGHIPIVATTFVDDFDRADTTPPPGGAGLGPNWVNTTNTFYISGNHATKTPGDHYTRWATPLSHEDQFVEVEIPWDKTTNFMWFHIRAANNIVTGGPPFGVYEAGINTTETGGGNYTNRCEMGIIHADGSYTVLGRAFTVANSPGLVGKLRLEAIGNRIRFYVDDILNIEAFDSELHGHYVGLNCWIGGTAGEAWYNTFTAGVIIPPTGSGDIIEARDIVVSQPRFTGSGAVTEGRDTAFGVGTFAGPGGGGGSATITMVERLDVRAVVNSAGAGAGSGNFTSAPFTTAAGTLLVAVVTIDNQDILTPTSIPLPTTTGLTWVKRAEMLGCASNQFSANALIYVANNPTAGSKTFTMSGSGNWLTGINTLDVWIGEFTGAAAALAQTKTPATFYTGVTSSPNDPGSRLISLPSAPASNSWRIGVYAGDNSGNDHAVGGTGWTEQSNHASTGPTPPVALVSQVQTRTGDLSPTVLWDDLSFVGTTTWDYVLIGWELIAVSTVPLNSGVITERHDTVVGVGSILGSDRTGSGAIVEARDTVVTPQPTLYPASISGRKLLDQVGNVYLAKSMSSWFLTHLSNVDITHALTDVRANGFNGVTVWCGGTEDRFGFGNKYTNLAGQNFWSGTPWASSLGPAWVTVDWIVAECARLGLVLHLSFCHGWGGNGCAADWVSATNADMYNVGVAVATRYASAHNIVWHVMFDSPTRPTDPAGVRIRSLFDGINDTEGASTRPIRWCETDNGVSTSSQGWYDPTGASTDTRFSVNCMYTWGGSATDSIEGVYSEVSGPIGDCEPVYVGNTDSYGLNRQELRERPYSVFLEGGSLMNWGHEAFWPMDEPTLYPVGGMSWQDVVSDPATLDARYCWNLIEAYCKDPTWDRSNTFVTAGQDSGGAKAAIGASNTAAIAYFPHNRGVVVDTTIFPGIDNVRLRWYDPATGTFITIATSEAQQAARTVTMPATRGDSTADYVLVADIPTAGGIVYPSGAFMGTTPITTVYLGTTPVTELYVGDTKMWP